MWPVQIWRRMGPSSPRKAPEKNNIFFFYQISLIVPKMPHHPPTVIWHEMPALAREGMQQSAIAGRVGLTCATIKRILWRHAATGTLMYGLYGIRAGHKTINNWLLFHGYYAYIFIKKPLLTADHRHLRLERPQRWRNLTMAHWQHVIFSDEARFQLYLVDGRCRAHRLPGEHFQKRCQAYRVQAGAGSDHTWGAFHCSAIASCATRKKPHWWALQRHCPGSILGITTKTKTPHLSYHALVVLAIFNSLRPSDACMRQ